MSDSPPRHGGVLRVVWSLGLVVALIGGLALLGRHLARRSGGLIAAIGAGGRSPAGVLEVLGRYPVGRGQTLVLLRLDRRLLLLSQSAPGLRGGGGVSALCEVTDPDEVAQILIKSRDSAGETAAERFRQLLSRADGEVERAVMGGQDSAEVWRPSRAIDESAGIIGDPADSLRRRLSVLRRAAGEARG